MESYFETIKPLFHLVETGDGLAEFEASIAPLPRAQVLLFCAHMALSEVANGGFLQLFWNSTGILVPEAIEGFLAIDMTEMAATLHEAASHLGNPYPRDREDRMDALLAASQKSETELEAIFRNEKNFYIAFVRATESLPFVDLGSRFYELADSERGGFQRAATKFALSL